LTISRGVCGVAMPQGWPSFGIGRLTGETPMNGTFNSLATESMALVPGALDVPIMISTWSCWTSLRAFCVAAEGSDPSSNLISLIATSPTLL
jgi:hypothetical protein